VAKTLEIKLVDQGLSRFIAGLNQAGQSAAFNALNRAAAQVTRDQQTLLQSQIYQTPLRGTPPYQRSGVLARAPKAWVTHDPDGFDLHIETRIDAKDYAPFNELGTRDYRLTPAAIIQAAQAGTAALQKLEFGRGQGTGLEARPFFYPSVVHTFKRLPRFLTEELKKATP
jgi:hypothetical protein